MRVRWSIGVAVAVLGCGTSSPDATPTDSDIGSDSTLDTADSRHDSSSDTGFDSGRDAAAEDSRSDVDSSPESSADSLFDSAEDDHGDTASESAGDGPADTVDGLADAVDSSDTTDVSEGPSDSTSIVDSADDAVGEATGDSGTDATSPPVCGTCPSAQQQECYGTTAPGECVSRNDPAFGCASGTCSLCSFSHASAQCLSGACAILACDDGWANCLGTSTGCTTNITSDSSNCGTCGHVCSAGESCIDGVCATSCSPPLTNCGSGGCVDLLTSSSNCGGCGLACTAPPGSSVRCVSGACIVSPKCGSGLTACGSACADLSNDPRNCGACGTVCPAPYNSLSACTAGVCDPCPTGTTLCPAAGTLGNWECSNLSRSEDNCGACGKGCYPTLGQVCSAGACVADPYTVFAGAVSDFVVDDTSIYFPDLTAGTITKIPKGGGTPVTLATGQARPIAIAQDTSFVYWSNYLGAAVMSAPKDGSAAPSIVAVAAEPWFLAVDDTYVYWANEADATLRRAPKSGGGAVDTLSTAATDPHFTWGSASSRTILSVAVTDPWVTFLAGTTDGTAGYYETYNTLTGATNLLFNANGTGANRQTVDGTTAYFYTPAPGASVYGVDSIPLSGGTASRVWWPPTPASSSYAWTVDQVWGVDGGQLYIGIHDYSPGWGIYRVDLCTARAATLVVANTNPVKVHFDSTYIYWSDTTKVSRITK